MQRMLRLGFLGKERDMTEPSALAHLVATKSFRLPSIVSSILRSTRFMETFI